MELPSYILHITTSQLLSAVHLYYIIHDFFSSTGHKGWFKNQTNFYNRTLLKNSRGRRQKKKKVKKQGWHASIPYHILHQAASGASLSYKSLKKNVSWTQTARGKITRFMNLSFFNTRLFPQYVSFYCLSRQIPTAVIKSLLSLQLKASSLHANGKLKKASGRKLPNH